MEPFDLELLLRALSGGATVCGTREALETRFRGVSTDSRTCAPGDLFFALRGERFDGHDFLPAAIARGAAGAIVREDAKVSVPPTLPLVRVLDPLRALGAVAAEYRRRLRARVVAITGSSGKTTTRELLAHLLSGRGVVRSEKSFNNAVGVPLTLFRADRTTKIVICEVGTSAPGEIAALGRIVQPDVAVVTSVGPAHLERLGSLDGVAKEKGALVAALRPGGLAVLYGDDPLVRALAERAPDRGSIFFGESERVEVRGEILPGPETTRLRVYASGEPPCEVTLPFPGRHNAWNALAALATARVLGESISEAAPRLATARLPGRRLELVRVGPFEVFDDAYNANPASTEAALEVFEAVHGRKIFVFGGMRELGQASAEYHRKIGEHAARAGFAVFAAVGPEAAVAADAAVAAGFAASAAERFATPEEAAAWLGPRLLAGDRILVKGSRAARLERFIEELAARVVAKG